MRTITGLRELKDAEGEELGTSDWHEVTQDDVNTFADVTGDHQWIHVDVERAKDTPFGGTIAHGYYTLSLVPKLAEQIVSYEGFAFGLNYGLDRVRFPAAMPVGGRVRATPEARCRSPTIPGGAQIKVEVTLRARGRRQAGLRRRDARTRLRIALSVTYGSMRPVR